MGVQSLTASPLANMLGRGLVWSANDSLKDQQTDAAAEVLSSGFPALDQQLPGGGWQAGQVCELYGQPGHYDVSLLFPALAQLSHQPGWILWVAPAASSQATTAAPLPYSSMIPYPVALHQAGIDVAQLLVVQPENYEQAVWCMEQGLRSAGCTALLGWLTQWHKPHIRRLQLAAQEQHKHCWLWPQTPFDSSGSPAALRLSVQRCGPQLRLQFLKRRGSWPGQPFTLSLPEQPVCPERT